MYTSVIFSVLALVAASNAATCGLGLSGYPLGLGGLPLAVESPLGLGCGSLGLGYGSSGLGCGSCGLGCGSCGLGCGYESSLLPRVISNQCTCTKTVVRPKISQIVKDVPAVRRVVQNIATPVLEQHQYPAVGLDNGCGYGCGGIVDDIVAPSCGCGGIYPY